MYKRIVLISIVFLYSVMLPAQLLNKLAGSIRKSASKPKGEMVYTNKHCSNFEEAKQNMVSKVNDGEPLWLYIKFEKPVGEMAFANSKEDENGVTKVDKYFHCTLGPANDAAKEYKTARISLNESMLNSNELELCLSPGSIEKNRSLDILLKVLTTGKAGVWENEIRIHGKDYEYEFPIAKGAITCDVSAGFPKYKKIFKDMETLEYRGLAATNELAPRGKANNPKLLQKVNELLKNERGITVVKSYFTQDNYSEWSNEISKLKESRHIWVAYTYKENNECLFERVEVWQDYSYGTADYTGQISLRYYVDPIGHPIKCELLK